MKIVFNSKLYWSDWNRASPKIESSNLDGTERNLLLSSPQVTLPNSLALSLSTGEICYADAGNKKIECELAMKKSSKKSHLNSSF